MRYRSHKDAQTIIAQCTKALWALSSPREPDAKPDVGFVEIYRTIDTHRYQKSLNYTCGRGTTREYEEEEAEAKVHELAGLFSQCFTWYGVYLDEDTPDERAEAVEDPDFGLLMTKWKYLGLEEDLPAVSELELLAQVRGDR